MIINTSLSVARRAVLSLLGTLLAGCVNTMAPGSQSHPQSLSETDEELSVVQLRIFDWVSPQAGGAYDVINVPVAGTHDVIPYEMDGHVAPNVEAQPALAVTAKSGSWLSRGDRARAYEAASSWCEARNGQVVGLYGGIAFYVTPPGARAPGWIFPVCAPPDKSAG